MIMDAPLTAPNPASQDQATPAYLKKETKKTEDESQALREVGPDFLELFDRVENVLKLAASVMLDEKDPEKAMEMLVRTRQEFLEKKREEIKARPIMLEAAEKQPNMLEYFIESHLSQMRAEFDGAMVDKLLSMKPPGSGSPFFLRIDGSSRLFNDLLKTLKEKNEKASEKIIRKIEPYKGTGWGHIGRGTNSGGFAMDATLNFIGAKSYTGDIKVILNGLEKPADPAENTGDKLARIKNDPQSWVQETMNKRYRAIREQVAKKFGPENFMAMPTIIHSSLKEVLSALAGYDDVIDVSGTGEMTFVKLRGKKIEH